MSWIHRILLCMLLAGTAAQAQTDNAMAQRLLRQSGLWEQLGQVSGSYADGSVTELAKAAPRASDAEKNRLHRLMSRAFSADRLQATAVRVVSQDMQARHTEPVLDWYGTGAGQAIRQAEVRASDEQARLPMDKVLQAGQEVMQRMPDDRRQLITDITKASRAAESMLQITEGSLLALQRGLALAAPEQPTLSEQQVRRALRSQRQTMLAAFTEIARASTALTYHGVSDDDLRAYLAFCNSPHGRHFFEVSVKAFEQALSRATEDMAQALPSIRDQQNL